MKMSMFYCLGEDGEQLITLSEFSSPDTQEAKNAGFTWNEFETLNKMIFSETGHYIQDFYYCKKCGKLYIREHKPAEFQPEGEETPSPQHIIKESKDAFWLDFIKKAKKKKLL